MSDVRMKVVHKGQYEPYGDHYNIWKLETDLPEEEVLKFCLREIMSNRYVPTKEQWEYANREGGFGLDYYFRGYYTLERYSENTWMFSRIMPYTG